MKIIKVYKNEINYNDFITVIVFKHDKIFAW